MNPSCQPPCLKGLIPEGQTARPPREPGTAEAQNRRNAMIKAKRFGHVTFETSDLERQIAYFTEVAGLVLAERENGRAYLATKLGDLVVQLESGGQARCARLAFQVAPETDFNDIRGGIEAEGLRCDARNDP